MWSRRLTLPSSVHTELSFNFFQSCSSLHLEIYLLVPQLFRGFWSFFVYQVSVPIVFLSFLSISLLFLLSYFVQFIFILYLSSFEFLRLAFAYSANFFSPSIFCVFSANYFERFLFPRIFLSYKRLSIW